MEKDRQARTYRHAYIHTYIYEHKHIGSCVLKHMTMVSGTLFYAPLSSPSATQGGDAPAKMPPLAMKGVCEMRTWVARLWYSPVASSTSQNSTGRPGSGCSGACAQSARTVASMDGWGRVARVGMWAKCRWVCGKWGGGGPCLARSHPCKTLALVRQKLCQHIARLRRFGQLALVLLQPLKQCLCPPTEIEYVRARHRHTGSIHNFTQPRQALCIQTPAHTNTNTNAQTSKRASLYTNTQSTYTHAIYSVPP
jgi:hypothetical protein